MKNRVVITGYGVISSMGNTPDEILTGMKAGRAGFVRPEADKTVVAAPVTGFSIREYTGRCRNSRYLNRGAAFAVAAALQAVRSAGQDLKLPDDTALFLGAGPQLDLGGEIPGITDGWINTDGLQALWMLRFLPNTPASLISRLLDIHGENSVIGTACSASLQAIGEAYRRIRDGYAKVCLAGGGDSRISHGGILAYKMAGALFSGEGDPDDACRPFDKKRSGFVPGEGGGMVMMESLEHAEKRGGRILCEICGYGASLDGHAMTAPDPEGVWAEKAVLQAIAEACLKTDDIDLISAHGTGTLLNDDMESRMITRIFGKSRPAVMALKSWTGHISAACGAVETAVILTCLQANWFPHIRNLKEPCCEGLNFIRKSGSLPVRHVIMQNFGFGGQNSALVLKKWDR